jgi:hypothetical protein
LLTLWLRPAGDDRVRAQIVGLGATMKHRESGQDTARILKAYIADLSDLPAFGLIQACEAFRRIDVGDGWMPTSGEIRQEAQLRAMWAQQQLSDIQAILIAKVPLQREPIERRREIAEAMRRRIGIGGHEAA